MDSTRLAHTESKPIVTFSQLSAPRPKIIPSYATSFLRRPRRALGIHQDLPEKALFHPYTRPAKPQKIDIPPTLCDSSPGSPLTPLENEPSNGSSTASSSACCIIFIPPPVTGVTVLTAGWPPGLLKSYRSFARDAVKAHLDYSKSLSTQIPKAVEQAQQYIEDKIPLFKNHQDHWGANALLRDQLKSVKDTRTKAEGRAAEKEKMAREK